MTSALPVWHSGGLVATWEGDGAYPIEFVEEFKL